MHKPCTVDGCDRKHYGRGLCSLHYQRATYRGTLHRHPRTLVAPGASLDERLRHHGWTTTPAGCWEWNGSRHESGYGQMASGRYRNGDPQQSIPIQTHRAAYLAWVGEISDDLVVRHKCDNPPCINPDHLELGTHTDNNRDAVSRWRTANGERKKHKLTDAQVREIRTRYGMGGLSQKALANEYGVCQQLISGIVRGRRRARPTNPPLP